MTIDTYGELKTAVANWLERTDLTSRIPEFIALAQSKMYRGVMGLDGRTWRVPPLRVRNMITTADIAVTSGSGSLPSGWLEFVRLWISDTDQRNLEYLPPPTFYNWASSHTEAAGEAVQWYTIEGLTIRLAPPNTETVKSVHYATFTAMSADGDADWVMTNAPHAYLHGALAEAWGFIGGNDQQEAKHAAEFAAAILGLNAQYEASQRSGAALIMRPRAVV
jgi:hypothetical protein